LKYFEAHFNHWQRLVLVAMLTPTIPLQSTRHVGIHPLLYIQRADYFVVPKPSLPRPVYKMMPSSSPKFMGCEDYLQKLDEFFHVRIANDLTRRVFVLFGVGGVGKTQICLKFAEKSSDK
jgi:hypothetical protein